jgi:hypothetical protein
MSSPGSPSSGKKKKRKPTNYEEKWKHKYDVHFRDWEINELKNLVDVVEEAPEDLGHKARWKWIAKSMTTERVFTIYDCHHAYSEHRLYLERKREAELKAIEDRKEKDKRREEFKRKRAETQREWNSQYEIRLERDAHRSACTCKAVEKCRTIEELHHTFRNLLDEEEGLENGIGDPGVWIKTIEDTFAVKEVSEDGDARFSMQVEGAPWTEETKRLYALLVNQHGRMYTNAFVGADIQAAIKRCENALVRSSDYGECVRTLSGPITRLVATKCGGKYYQMDKFKEDSASSDEGGEEDPAEGSNVENLGIAQVYFHSATARYQIVVASNYNHAISPSRSFRQHVRLGLQEAGAALECFASCKPVPDGSMGTSSSPWARLNALAAQLYGRALACSGYVTGLGAWKTTHDERRSAAQVTIEKTADVMVESLVAVALEEERAAAFQRLRDNEKRRLKKLTVEGLDGEIEGMRKQYRAVKKTISKVGARAQKQCDELRETIKATEDDKVFVLARERAKREEKNNFAKMDAKRTLKKRLDATIGIREPEILPDVHALAQKKEEEYRLNISTIRERVANVFTPRATDFKSAESQLVKSYHAIRADEEHAGSYPALPRHLNKNWERTLGSDYIDKDDDDSDEKGEEETAGKHAAEKRGVMNWMGGQYILPMYNVALLYADFGRLHYYISVVAEAEGVSITGTDIEPTVLYKQAVKEFRTALEILESYGASSSLLYAELCEELAKVHARRLQWGDQSEAFMLCSRAIGIYTALDESKKKQEAVERCNLYSMYQINDQAIREYTDRVESKK